MQATGAATRLTLKPKASTKRGTARSHFRGHKEQAGDVHAHEISPAVAQERDGNEQQPEDHADAPAPGPAPQERRQQGRNDQGAQEDHQARPGKVRAEPLDRSSEEHEPGRSVRTQGNRKVTDRRIQFLTGRQLPGSVENGSLPIIQLVREGNPERGDPQRGEQRQGQRDIEEAFGDVKRSRFFGGHSRHRACWRISRP
jgi:hypothetical protein